MPTDRPAPDTFLGRWVRLDPIEPNDVPDLARLLLADGLHPFAPLWYPIPRNASEALHVAEGEFLGRHNPDGTRLTWVVRLVADAAPGKTGRLVGTTSLSEIDLPNERGHVGGTIYHPDVWGTVVNPETKLLLLGACFERWGLGRVKIQTDALNLRSRAAIEKLGAVPEGIQRRESRRGDGTFRDTAVYSIIRDEWPAVRAGLRARLDRR